MWTLGIDATRANESRRTGLPLYNLRMIQELRHIVPEEVRVVLYSPTPLGPDLADLPPNWSSRVLRWPRRQLWNQLRLGLEMALRPPDVLLLLHHLLPVARPPKTVALIADIGFEREEGLYGTVEEDGAGRGVGARLANGLVRLATRGRYGLGEQDYHRWTTRQAVRRANRLIAISEFTRSEVCEVYGVDPAGIGVAYPGVDGERFSTPVPPARATEVLERYGIREPYILYVGRLERKKNVARLVRAFGMLEAGRGRPHQLVLAGTPGKGYEEIRQAIGGTSAPAGSICETGWLDHEDLPAVVQRASVFAFVTNYEGFGIPVLEAQAAGVPVVCSDLPVLREAAGEGALFCDHRSPEAIGAAMAKAVADDDTRDRASAAGRRNSAAMRWETGARALWENLPYRRDP